MNEKTQQVITKADIGRENQVSESSQVSITR